MVDDETLIYIDKAFWPKGLVRGLTPALRSLGEKHGNMVLAAQPTKGCIMMKGTPKEIEGAKPALLELITLHFPDAPIPEELGGDAYMNEPDDVRDAVPAAEPQVYETIPESSPAAAVKNEEKPVRTEATVPTSQRTTPPSVPVASSKYETKTPVQQPGPRVKVGYERCPVQQPGPRVKVETLSLRAADAIAEKALAVHGQLPPGCLYHKRVGCSAAPALMWECMRKNCSFIRKSGQQGSNKCFTAEPQNLMGYHSYKYSGIVARDGLDVKPSTVGIKERVALLKNPAKGVLLNKPVRRISKTGLSKCPRWGFATLEQEVRRNSYRPGLLSVARLKYLKILKTFKKKRRQPRSRRCKKVESN